MAMDPVHGSQWSVSSTDITLTAKQGAALTSSYGSNGMGEVSTGTASTAFKGQRSQPTDAMRQLFIVDDTALTGHPSHSAAVHGDTPMEVEMGPACGTLKCENAAICEKVAKCEKYSTLNVKIDAICEKIMLNVKKWGSLNVSYISTLNVVKSTLYVQTLFWHYLRKSNFSACQISER